MRGVGRTFGGLGALAGAAALTAVTGGPALGDVPPVTWRVATSSPRAGAGDSALAPLLAACGGPDGALAEVAARSAQRLAEGGSPFAADELAFQLRAAGDPHVWPRAWSMTGVGEEEVGRNIKAWVAPWNTLGVRRCGIARAAAADGSTSLTVVAVDALADLSPLPTTARTGQWITLDGAMLVPASDAKVVLLGPRGAPKSVPASLSGDRVHSTFSVDQPGAWLVQVLATVSTGPQPVLEAMIFAGSPPPARFAPAPAPGEGASQGARDDDDAMVRMVNAARASESRPALVRDPLLDRVARAHSEEMLKARVLGHDVGTGSPTARLRAAGGSAHVAGENVATSNTVENAHRALWASPSHRGNLLFDDFTRVGVAVVRGPDGRVWVTEMFAG